MQRPDHLPGPSLNVCPYTETKSTCRLGQHHKPCRPRYARAVKPRTSEFSDLRGYRNVISYRITSARPSLHYCSQGLPGPHTKLSKFRGINTEIEVLRIAEPDVTFQSFIQSTAFKGHLREGQATARHCCLLQRADRQLLVAAGHPRGSELQVADETLVRLEAVAQHMHDHQQQAAPQRCLEQGWTAVLVLCVHRLNDPEEAGKTNVS